MIMKIILLFVFFQMGLISFSQIIELDHSKVGQREPFITIADDEQGGFVEVNVSEINHVFQNGEIKNYKWKDLGIKMEVKMDLSFDPEFILKNERGYIIIVKYYNTKEKQYEVHKCSFDSDFKLISDDVVWSEKEKNFNYWVVKKSSNDRFFIVSKMEIVNTDFKISYDIFDKELSKIKSGNIFMIKPENINPQSNSSANNPEGMLRSIDLLEEGDPIINFFGRLYLLGQNDVIPFDLELEQEITSYKICQDKDKKMVLIGSYQENPKTAQKRTGMALIRFNEDLTVNSQSYELLPEEFDISADDLYAKSKNKNSEQRVNKAHGYLLSAAISEDGSVRAVYFGSTFDKDWSFNNPIMPPLQNLCIVQLNKSDEFTNKIVIPITLNTAEGLKAIHGKNHTIIASDDYQCNYNVMHNFEPNLERDKKTTLGFDKQLVIIDVDHSNNSSTRKVVVAKNDQDKLPNGFYVNYCASNEPKFLLAGCYIREKIVKFTWLTAE